MTTTATRTVAGLSRLLVLVLVPVTVTVCATITYVAEEASLCHHGRPPPPPHTLAKCDYDSDCVENAYCWYQEACYCKEGFVAYRNRTHVQCLKVAASMGDPCLADVQCRVTFAAQSDCRDNVCQCSPGSRFEEGRCYESVGLGQVCQTHHNCRVKDSYCVSGYCDCNLQYHPSPDNSRCLQSSHLGQNCSHDDYCVAENSRCIEQCVCKVDYVLSGDKRRCLKAANSVGDRCEENSQCTEFLEHSECHSETRRCTCLENYHRRGTMCARNVGLGQKCTRHEECVTLAYRDSASTEVTNVDCVDDRCTCANNYIMTEESNNCIPYGDVSAATRLRAFAIFWIVLVLIYK